MQGWFFILMFILSIAFSGLVGVALLTYVRRTWQLIRAESDRSIQHRILDGIDQLQTRMDLLSDRLDGLDGSLPSGASQRELEGGEEGAKKAFPLNGVQDS